MLTIWSKAPENKVLTNLSSVLKHFDGEVCVVKNFSVPDGTKAVLAMGTDALEFLHGCGAAPKNKKITSLRESGMLSYVGVPLFVTYSPTIDELDPSWYTEMLTDVATAVRLCVTGSTEAKLGEYRWVEDFSETITKINERYALTGQPVDVSPDLETVGSDPLAPGKWIVSCSISVEEGKSDVVYFYGVEDEQMKLRGGFDGGGLIGEQIAWIVSTPKVRLKGANLGYDKWWLKEHGGIMVSNDTMDTTLVGSLLDENRPNSLDLHVKIYAPVLGGYSDEFDRTVDKNKMHLVPKDKLLPYAGGDTDGCLRIANVMKKEMAADPALAGFYVNILHPASRAFEALEQGGIFVDRDRFEQLGADVTKKMDEITIKAKSVLGGLLVARHYDATKVGGINLTKPSLLSDFFFTNKGLNLKPQIMTEKSGKPSSSVDHLMMFKDHPDAKPFLDVFEEYSQASKVKSTYYEGFLEHLRFDNRFHPHYFLFVGNKQRDKDGGAKTGRLSAKNPPFQVIPKHHPWAKQIRGCFVAPPGFVVVERDYAQGELKVIACVANEETMIASYQAGRDLHIETSAEFAGYTYDELAAMEHGDVAAHHLFEETRQLGKAGNFGLIYAMGVEGFMDYAFDNYKVKISYERAEKFRNGFFAKYTQLPIYHAEYKKFAHKHGYVRSQLGRIRHLPLINSYNSELRSKAERQAINSPIQSVLSDMMLWTMALEFSSGLTKVSPAFGNCHDATYNYMLENLVDKQLPQHMQVMQNLPFHLVNWAPQLQFTADAKTGPSMGELKKYKLAA